MAPRPPGHGEGKCDRRQWGHLPVKTARKEEPVQDDHRDGLAQNHTDGYDLENKQQKNVKSEDVLKGILIPFLLPRACDSAVALPFLFDVHLTLKKVKQGLGDTGTTGNSPSTKQSFITKNSIHSVDMTDKADS